MLDGLSAVNVQIHTCTNAFGRVLRRFHDVVMAVTTPFLRE